MFLGSTTGFKNLNHTNSAIVSDSQLTPEPSSQNLSRSTFDKLTGLIGKMYLKKGFIPVLHVYQVKISFSDRKRLWDKVKGTLNYLLISSFVSHV